MEKNRITTYLLYAVGEIVLVVIGILIALQLNTANDLKKDRQLEKKYLQGILTNLEDDIGELQGHILTDSLNLNGYTSLIRAFVDKSYKSDVPTFISTITRIQLVNAFEGNSIVFEDLKSAGRTNLILSDSLRYLILNYYSQANSMKYEERETSNPVIIQLRNELFISEETGINGIESQFFPPYWSAQLKEKGMIEEVLAFYDKDPESPLVKGYANRAGYIKALIWAKRRDRVSLQKEARKVHREITEYLDKN